MCASKSERVIRTSGGRGNGEFQLAENASWIRAKRRLPSFPTVAVSAKSYLRRATVAGARPRRPRGGRRWHTGKQPVRQGWIGWLAQPANKLQPAPGHNQPIQIVGTLAAPLVPSRQPTPLPLLISSADVLRKGEGVGGRRQQPANSNRWNTSGAPDALAAALLISSADVLRKG
jgi:hypothetical protein